MGSTAALPWSFPTRSIVTGYNTPQLHAAASLILSAARRLAGLPADEDLLPTGVVESISHLKKDVLGRKRVSLDAEEALIALGISAASDLSAEVAVEKTHGVQGMRGPHDPHALPGRRGGPQEAGREPDDRATVRLEEAVRELKGTR